MAMKNEKELIEKINRHLDQGISDLDPGTLSGIKKARINALYQKRTGWILRQIPVGWVAAAILVMVIAANLFTDKGKREIPRLAGKVENKQAAPESKVILKPTVNVENTPIAKIENEMKIEPDQVALIEMLSDEKELELYENMEFYSWIAEDTRSSG
jgi:hypothetical protein